MDCSIFDIDSLEELGIICQEENIRAHVFSPGLDPTSGLYEFKAHRKPKKSETVYSILKDAIVGDEPEITSLIEANPKDRVVFVFKDRFRDYRQRTLVIPNHGCEAESLSTKEEEVELFIPRTYESGFRIASIRANETLSSSSEILLELNRGGIEVTPGSVFFYEGSSYAYRCASIKPYAQSSLVELKAAKDFQADTVDPTSELPDDYEPPEGQLFADVGGGIYEASRFVLPTQGGFSAVIPMRWRGNCLISGATIYYSLDDAQYFFVGTTNFSLAGGALLEEIKEDSPIYWEEGFRIDPRGFDGLDIQDYRTNPSAWFSGQQLMVIDDELFYVRNAVVESATSVRMEGVLRARHATARRQHDAGSNVFVFPRTGVNTFFNVDFQRGRTVFFKIVPATPSGSLGLNGVPAIPVLMQAPAGRPMRVGEIMTTTATSFNLKSFRTGQDIALSWAYKTQAGLSARSGAGFQQAGEATFPSPREGAYKLFIRDSGGAIKRQVSNHVIESYVYDNATMRSDFGGVEPTDFSFEVINFSGARDSDPASVSVKRV